MIIVSGEKKDKHCLIPLISRLYEVPTGVRFIETESRGCQGLGEVDGELVFNGHRLSVWENEKSSIDGR